jgi:hypothetical protein
LRDLGAAHHAESLRVFAGRQKSARALQEIGKRAMQEPDENDAGNDKKNVRWRIANLEEAQTQGETVEVLPRHGASNVAGGTWKSHRNKR